MTQDISAIFQHHPNPYQMGYHSKDNDIETKKTAFLQTTQTKLEQFLQSHGKKPPVAHEKKKTPFNLYFKKAFYYFLLCFGLLEDLGGNYIFSYSLFSLISGLANPFQIGLSLLYATLNGVLYYAFGVTYLKDSLNLPSLEPNPSLYIDEYLQQLKLVQTINDQLRDVGFCAMQPQEYAQYIESAETFNRDLTERNTLFLTQSERESTQKKIFKWTVVGFGFLSRGIGSSFMANTILAGLYAPLIGTPLGWTLILLTVASGLGLYYAMEVKSMLSLINPHRTCFLKLKKAVASFTPIEAAAFEQLKNQMHPKVRSNASTHTEEPMCHKTLFAPASEEPVCYQPLSAQNPPLSCLPVFRFPIRP